MDELTQKNLIVVVDYDKEVLDSISNHFRDKEMIVTCFKDPKLALKESERSGKNWDVILTDFHFANMTGVDFTVEVKKVLPNIPIILITPPELTEVAATTLKKGAYDIVSHPVHLTQLEISVNRALELLALKGDIHELRRRVREDSIDLSKIIGRSPNFLKALDLAKRVSSSSANIFITGESGSGKEVFAKYIHQKSKHASGPFVAINCSAIPENLLESELFGHCKGAFTGAIDKKIGLFEEAQDGTLFLDEIGDLSLPLQAKLLRVLQERKIKRVGENTFRPINCRIITATHKDLIDEIQHKHFREDLFFRLNVIPLFIPPLRERKEDIVPLAESFLQRFAKENGSNAKTFSKEALKYILENDWRGNVRELENAIERAVVLSSQNEIPIESFMPEFCKLNCEPIKKDGEFNHHIFSLECQNQLPTLDEVIQKYIEFAIKKNGGAKDKTAAEIGIDRKTLYKRIKH